MNSFDIPILDPSSLLNFPVSLKHKADTSRRIFVVQVQNFQGGSTVLAVKHCKVWYCIAVEDAFLSWVNRQHLYAVANIQGKAQNVEIDLLWAYK